MGEIWFTVFAQSVCNDCTFICWLGDFLKPTFMCNIWKCVKIFYFSTKSVAGQLFDRHWATFHSSLTVTLAPINMKLINSTYFWVLGDAAPAFLLVLLPFSCGRRRRGLAKERQWMMRCTNRFVLLKRIDETLLLLLLLLLVNEVQRGLTNRPNLSP